MEYAGGHTMATSCNISRNMAEAESKLSLKRIVIKIVQESKEFME